MQTNNFDSSSSGVNLELNVFLDGEASRIDFEETFHVIQYSGYRTTCQLFYTDFGQVEFTGSLLDYFNLPENTSSKELFLKWLEFSGSDAKDELTGLKWENDGKRLGEIEPQGIHEYVTGVIRSDSELAEWFEQAGYTCTLESIGVYGYSQGDYAEVYFLPDHPISFDYAQNLIYSAPVYCALDVDNETYLLETSDRYNYNKDEILEEAKNTIEHPQLPYILEWLEENLPEYPEYCG